MEARHLLVAFAVLAFAPTASAGDGLDACVYQRDPIWTSHVDPTCAPNAGASGVGYDPGSGTLTLLVEACTGSDCLRLVEATYQSDTDASIVCATIERELGPNSHCTLP